MLLRVLSAVILVPAVLALVIYGPPWLFLLAIGVVGTLGLYEYFHLVRAIGLGGQPWFAYAAYWALLIAFHQDWFPSTVLMAGMLLAAFLAAMWSQVPMRERTLSLMTNLLGILYFLLCLYPILPLRYDFGDRLGLHWLLILFAVIWAGDTAAMFVGKTFGRTLFAPRLSPKKTNEGAIAGLLGGAAAAILLQQLLFVDLPLVHVIVVSLLLGMFGQLGDVAESMLKRAADVKDSSHLIPGHGGVLDRIDSLLFAFPVLYLYLLRLYSAY